MAWKKNDGLVSVTLGQWKEERVATQPARVKVREAELAFEEASIYEAMGGIDQDKFKKGLDLKNSMDDSTPKKTKA